MMSVTCTLYLAGPGQSAQERLCFLFFFLPKSESQGEFAQLSMCVTHIGASAVFIECIIGGGGGGEVYWSDCNNRWQKFLAEVEMKGMGLACASLGPAGPVCPILIVLFW